jgi:hypothetical protein
MKTIICGALTALAVTAAGAAEDTRSANYVLPHCKAFINRQATLDLWQGFCMGV